MSTPPDLSPVAAPDEKTNPGPQGTQSLATRDRKAAASDHLSLSPSPVLQPPASTRSTFASICIVAACTSAQITSIGLGPAYAISVPYVGKDLHIQKEDLQWILNAYSISSVNNPILTAPVQKCSLWPCAQGCFLLLCGRLADLYGRKRMWLIGYSILVVFGIGAGFAQCTFSSVRFGAGYVILTHQYHSREGARYAARDTRDRLRSCNPSLRKVFSLSVYTT